MGQRCQRQSVQGAIPPMSWKPKAPASIAAEPPPASRTPALWVICIACPFPGPFRGP